MCGKLPLWLALAFLTIQVASSSWWIWNCCERKKESINLNHEFPLESSFQKMRWFQCWMLRSQRKVPGHITRLILSYLSIVPVTSRLCPHKGILSVVAISRNSRWLLSTTNYYTSHRPLHLSDLTTGERVRTFTAPTCSIWSCAIADNNSFVAAGGWENIYVWNTNSKKLVTTLTGHRYAASICTIFFNDTRLASGSSDETVRVWQVKNFQWKSLYVFRRHTDEIISIFTWADKSGIISFANDKTVWNSDTGNCHQILTCRTNNLIISRENCMSLDQRVVGIISLKGTETKLWDITTKKCTLTIPNISGIHDWGNHCIVYLSSKRIVWYKSYVDLEVSKVGVWNLVENKNIYTLSFEMRVKLVSVSTEGKYLIIVLSVYDTKVAFVQVYDFKTGTFIE